ncbi:MAG: peptide ABC transporter substrate-binding protein [Tissierellia bacterium]|nr:peptide ABC transporter substrate-binding protein [Tissierellia bacterium]
MFKKRLLALLLVMGLVLSACGGGEDKPVDEGNGVEDTSDEEAVEPGEKDAEQYLNTWQQEEPTTLNSAKNSDQSSYLVLLNVMEPLVRSVEKEDHTLEIEPAAAESWDLSEDGLTYTFHIREGMTWSDGEALTAHDYEFGIKRALDAVDGAGGAGYLIDCIKGAVASMNGEIESSEVGVTATDDHTLVIEVEEPTSYFLELCSTRPTMPIRQDVYEEQGQGYGGEADSIVTCGPFNLDEWVHQTELKLSKNEDYWDADSVNYENVSWRIIDQENTRMNAFLNGEIDSVGSNKMEWRQQFETLDNVNHDEVTNNALDYLFFNTTKQPFNNAKVRRAFSLAVNREEAITAIYNDVGNPAYGWVVPTIQIGDDEYRDVIPGPLEAMKDEDPRELLIEGLKEEGLSEDPADLTVKLEFGGTGEKMKEIGDYFLNSIKGTLGVDIQVATNEWSAFVDQVNNGNFEIGYMAWMADYNDPYAMLSLHLTDVNGLYTGWSNEKYDQLVRDARAEEDVEKQKEMYEEAETLLMEESPVVPIFNPVNNVYRYDYLFGYTINPFATQGIKYGYTSGR